MPVYKKAPITQADWFGSILPEKMYTVNKDVAVHQALIGENKKVTVVITACDNFNFVIIGESEIEPGSPLVVSVYRKSPYVISGIDISDNYIFFKRKLASDIELVFKVYERLEPGVWVVESDTL